MSSNPIDNKEEQARTAEAWKKLQAKLTAEPMSPKWADWPAAKQEEAIPMHVQNREHRQATPETNMNERSEPVASADAPQRRAPRRKWSGRRRFGAVAAACVIFGVVASTPLGDKALAAILDQFRMQDVTVVQEEDLRSMYQVFTDDQSLRESMNKYGEFTVERGKTEGEYTPAEAAKQLGYDLIHKELLPANAKVYVSPSETMTFKLNVSEVNQTLKRLGATALLPESVDGKPITLTVPEQVQFNLNGADSNEWAYLSQLKVPFVKVDPSIDVEEAIEAVMNFPLLPDYLKENLKRSRILAGTIPMPVITGDAKSEKLTVGEHTVVVEEFNYGDNNTRYRATWIQDDQLISFEGGERYMEKDAFLSKLKELAA
ncbi:hypothetical protein FHS18_003951 [Paenibacillus phyllosphaerae]|uniref:DUF4367 domain-containing protein n=1 Tax=Paenibacillus phyllosphaerae TaxID=274593 RepID=A0A7W5FP51_9BACL|nr:hypothetical protein [Paenibacillus phyllosphaerae]MBB3111883.1 hypothetical protein [Paenibacillus phyllosphaerae]